MNTAPVLSKWKNITGSKFERRERERDTGKKKKEGERKREREKK